MYLQVNTPALAEQWTNRDPGIKASTNDVGSDGVVLGFGSVGSAASTNMSSDDASGDGRTKTSALSASAAASVAATQSSHFGSMEGRLGGI